MWGAVLGLVGYGLYKVAADIPRENNWKAGQRAMRAAMIPYLQAESDEEYRQQVKVARQREALLMVCVYLLLSSCIVANVLLSSCIIANVLLSSCILVSLLMSIHIIIFALNIAIHICKFFFVYFACLDNRYIIIVGSSWLDRW